MNEVGSTRGTLAVHYVRIDQYERSAILKMPSIVSTRRGARNSTYLTPSLDLVEFGCPSHSYVHPGALMLYYGVFWREETQQLRLSSVSLLRLVLTVTVHLTQSVSHTRHTEQLTPPLRLSLHSCITHDQSHPHSLHTRARICTHLRHPSCDRHALPWKRAGSAATHSANVNNSETPTNSSCLRVTSTAHAGAS